MDKTTAIKKAKKLELRDGKIGRVRIERISILFGTGSTNVGIAVSEAASSIRVPVKKKPKLTAAVRARILNAQKRRWQQFHAAKNAKDK